MATCLPCPYGFYQPEAGRTVCNQCPEGFTTLNIGTSELGLCKGKIDIYDNCNIFKIANIQIALTVIIMPISIIQTGKFSNNLYLFLFLKLPLLDLLTTFEV